MDTASALKKAASWLVSTQKADGSFGPSEGKFKEPHYYMRNIIITPQVLRALIFSGSEHATPAIRKALRFCIDCEVEEGEPLELSAFKMAALKISNCFTEECDEIITALQKNPVASWKSPLNIPILTNFSIITCIPVKDLHKSTAETLFKWLNSAQAKDKQGWGPEAGSKSSVPSFTAPAILSYIYAGGDPCSKIISNARKYLENMQDSDGSWRSSSLTIKKPTIYATAVCTMALLASSQNPVNAKVQAGINYLLKMQNQDGGWPLTPGEKSECYTTYFAVWCLSLFDYIKERLSSPAISALSEKVDKQFITSALFREFEDVMEQKFKISALKSLLRSKALGSTANAVRRRSLLLKILAEKPDCTVADLIDELRTWPEYEYLKKKSHITQIKADLDHLAELGLVQEGNFRYFVTLDVLNF